MTLQFIEGFDHETTALLGKKTTITSASIGALSAGRISGMCASLTNGVHEIVFRVDGSPTSFICGGGFKPLLSGPLYFFQIREGTTIHVELRWDHVEARLNVYRSATLIGSTPSGSVPIDTWSYVETKVVVHDSTGSVEVKVNGASVFSVTGIDTRNGGTGVITNVRCLASSSGDLDVDDVYGLDTTGAVNNDFLGDVTVVTLRPNAAGDSTQFTPSAGANYECTDETQVDSDTSYVESSTVGHVDLYNLGALGYTPANIFGVQVSAYARKDDAGTRTVRTKAKAGATTANGSALGLSTDYLAAVSMMEVNPDDSAAWEVADIDALQIGFEVDS